MGHESAPGVEWLMDKFDLDLSLVARLGGHSQPRTHRGKERFPGMTITYALIQMLEKVAEKTDRGRIITKACVNKLICNGNAVVGCEYGKAGVQYKEFGPVIFCSGGFGADFGQDSLLAKYRPDLLHLPTTNGRRFANELGRRDYVTGEMWKNKPPFRLCLNKAASDEIMWHCKHYTGRGVMKYYPSGADLAKDMGVDLQTLVDTHDAHYTAAKNTEKDPDGGSFPAYPS